MTSRVVSTFRPDDVYFVTHLHQGSFGVRGAGLDQRVVAGELALGGRPGIETTTDAIDIDQDVLSIGAAEGRQAAGLEPDDESGPTFNSIRPVSPARAGTWLATRAYLQTILARDDAMDSQLVVSAAARLLAALLLETFPTRRSPPDPRGKAPPPAARRPSGGRSASSTRTPISTSASPRSPSRPGHPGGRSSTPSAATSARPRPPTCGRSASTTPTGSWRERHPRTASRSPRSPTAGASPRPAASPSTTAPRPAVGPARRCVAEARAGPRPKPDDRPVVRPPYPLPTRDG
jgi:hypothetical protein